MADYGTEMQVHVEPPDSEEPRPAETSVNENTGPAGKFVSTVKFVKKWSTSSLTTERTQDRMEFMHRHKYHRDSSNDDSLWVAVKSKKLIHLLRPFAPNNPFLYWWTLVVCICVLYNTIVIIARETFDQLQETPWSIHVWFTIDYIADVIYIIDILVQLRIGFLKDGLVVLKSKDIAIHYVKTLSFKWDLIAILPLDFLYLIPAIGTRHTIVRVNRIIKIQRVLYFFSKTDSSTNYPNFFRLLSLLLYLFLIIHWNACFYFLISKDIGFGRDGWVYPMEEGNNATTDEFSNLFRQYIVSLYWSTLTLTTIGELPGPANDGEYTFMIFDFMVGVLIFATIIGMVSEIITNMNTNRTSFQSRLDTIKQYMRYRKVGKDLQKRVIKWFDYLYTNKQSLDEMEILQLLPDKLHAEIAIHVNFDLLSKVSIFEQCEAGLLEELVLKLKPQVYSPGDYVCRKGDIGKEMYIIKQGKLEVVNDNGGVIATLTGGSYFGEISILNLSGKGNRRTANVRSVGFSDLFCLSKSDLLQVLEEYPDARAMLEETGRRTLMKDGTITEEQNVTRDYTNADITLEQLHRRIRHLEQKVT